MSNRQRVPISAGTLFLHLGDPNFTNFRVSERCGLWILQPSTVCVFVEKEHYWPLGLMSRYSSLLGLGGPYWGALDNHTVDGRNPAPPKKSWNDDVPCKYQQTMVFHGFLGGAGFRPSTVGSQFPRRGWDYRVVAALIFALGLLLVGLQG